MFVGRKIAVVVILLLTSGLVLAQRLYPDLTAFVVQDLASAPVLELLMVFAIGAAFGAFADRLKFGPSVVGSSVIVFALSSVAGDVLFRTLGLGMLALLLPAFAELLPLRSVRLLDNDLSYGTYLWAFPVQQSLAFLGLSSSMATYIALSAALTLAIASASWFLVEKPALALRRRLPKQTSPDPH